MVYFYIAENNILLIIVPLLSFMNRKKLYERTSLQFTLIRAEKPNQMKFSFSIQVGPKGVKCL